MSVFRPLYDWALRQAQKPYAKFMLFFVAMIEPCLVPIPPDALLIPMILARREKAYVFAAICTLGSVIGGVIGYGVGALVMATFGQWVLDHYHMHEAFNNFSETFREWGVWIIFIKGFLPFIPFIIVSIVSGFTHFNIVLFIFAACVTRGGRFFLEAILLRRYGEPVQQWIERYMTRIGIGVLVVVIGGVWMVVER